MHPVSVYAFHDYNGNGLYDEGEPTLSGITTKINNRECTTNEEGRCSFGDMEEGHYKINVVDSSNRFIFYLLLLGC